MRKTGDWMKAVAGEPQARLGGREGPHPSDPYRESGPRHEEAAFRLTTAPAARCVSEPVHHVDCMIGARGGAGSGGHAHEACGYWSDSCTYQQRDAFPFPGVRVVGSPSLAQRVVRAQVNTRAGPAVPATLGDTRRERLANPSVALGRNDVEPLLVTEGSGHALDRSWSTTRSVSSYRWRDKSALDRPSAAADPSRAISALNGGRGLASG